MATLVEYRNALLAKPEIEIASEFFAPDGSDASRTQVGAALKRRIVIYRRLQSGVLREEAIDVAVIDLGGPAEEVVEEGAGSAKEQADPATVWRNQAEAWLTTNATIREPKIVEWTLQVADEDRETARVIVVLNEGASNAGPFVTKSYFAAKIGANILFGPIS